MKYSLLYVITLACSLSQTTFGMHYSIDFTARYPLQEYMSYYNGSGHWCIQLDFHDDFGVRYTETIDKKQLQNLCENGVCTFIKRLPDNSLCYCNINLPKDKGQAAVITQYYHKELHK